MVICAAPEFDQSLRAVLDVDAFRSRMRSAAFLPITIAGAFVLPLTTAPTQFARCASGSAASALAPFAE
jgi:hypothetical protein